MREVDYTLKTLSSSLLGESRTEVPVAELPARYENSQSLHQLLLLGESDAWLALGLAFQLAGDCLLLVCHWAVYARASLSSAERDHFQVHRMHLWL